MANLDHEKKFEWDSRPLYIMALLCQTISAQTFISMPLTAVTHGATGYLLGYTLAFVFIGIPLLYMEFIVSQFTARDCLEVWRIRPCLVHFGYVQLIWQIILFIYNHTIISFIIYYFLVSFQNPIPYLKCGKWAMRDCGMFESNYTVNQDCIKFKDEDIYYCDYLFKTFPVYQYWRYYLLGQNATYYYVAWRVCLASALACTLIFLSCFRKKKSLKWFLSFLTIYPVIGYILLLIGSLMQKGIIKSYAESMDANFSIFLESFRTSAIIQQVLFTLNIGTGLSFNLGASASFRTPCYANVVIAVSICTVFTMFAVCTLGMMTCPFVFETKIKPNTFINYAMALVFEKIPTLLQEYDYSFIWLLLSFSSNAVLGLSTNIIICQHLLEMLTQRYTIVRKYPGLTCFMWVICIFFVTTPLLCKEGLYNTFAFKKMSHLITIFLTVIECLVFVVWYGLEKFSEDVHFMQGIRPKNYMKLAWLLSGVVVAYVFGNEFYILYLNWDDNLGSVIGWCTLLTTLALVISITLVKWLHAAFKKQFREQLKIDPLWGPRSEVLMRSRAMFSAQAMTKEYIYRQYHFQAGVLARQRISNVRNTYLDVT